MSKEISSAKIDIALKEIELLNQAIARQENIGLKIRGWFLTLFTALTVAFLSNELIDLEPEAFLGLSIANSFFFFFIEISHRVVEIRAIKRSKEVEDVLMWGLRYRGPKISISLTTQNSKYWLEAIKNFRIYPTYVIVILISIIVFLYFNCT